MNSLLAAAAIPALVSSAIAAEFTIQPRISTGYQSYEYNAGNNSDVNTKVNYLFGGLGVTGQVGKFFIDLYGQTNLTEGEDDDPNAGGGRESDVNRNELNLTGGFAFNQHITAFGGLKYANIESDNDFDNGVSIDLETNYFGPFGGLALSHPILDLGSLTLTGSLAYLDGEETIENSNIVGDIDNEGNAFGYALGLGWSGRFGSLIPALGYGVGLDYSAYDFDGEIDDFDEKTLRARADLKYRF